MKPTPEQVAAAKAYARGTETPLQYALLRGPDTAIGPNHVTEILLAALEAAEAQRDGAYLERNRVVAALAKNFPSRVAKTAIDGWDPAWHNCVYIDLPTGQASWHYHDREEFLFADIPHVESWKWDGHSTEEKYRRIEALAHGESDSARLDWLQHQLANMDSKARGTWLRIGDKGRVQVHRYPLHAMSVWDDSECVMDSIPDGTNDLREAIDAAIKSEKE